MPISATVPEQQTILSQPIAVDRFDPSMTGPAALVPARIPGGTEPALVWIAGFRSSVISEDNTQQLSQEFMCHTNLEISSETRGEAPDPRQGNGRGPASKS